jgi:hypothetical protein
MRSALLFAALAAIAIAFAWSVEAEDAEPGAAPRLDAIEARLAAVEKRLRALEGSTAREEPRAPGPAPAAQGAQGRDALRATRISVSFEDESAVRVLRIVADYAKVSLVVAPEAMRRAQDAKVTIMLKNATAEEILDAVTAPVGLAWKIEDSGIVRVTVADGR